MGGFRYLPWGVVCILLIEFVEDAFELLRKISCFCQVLISPVAFNITNKLQINYRGGFRSSMAFAPGDSSGLIKKDEFTTVWSH